MTKQTLTWHENNAIWLQGTSSKTGTSSAADILKQTLELSLQLRFTRLGGCEPVNNRLKIKTADEVALIAMRDKASRWVNGLSNVFTQHRHWNSEMHFFLGYR